MKTKVSLDKNGLNLHPINITIDTWYYEEKNGIHVYYNGDFICIIPWQKLVASVKRKEASKNVKL